MKKVIIDCDPGHDDVLALMSAFANRDQIDLLGITTVAGNQTLDKVTNNILKVQDYLGFHYPVYRGYDAPLIKPVDVQPQAHGETGLDGPDIPEPYSKPRAMHAIEFMKKSLLENDLVTIICIGPLTNMALFLKTYPELKSHIEQIIIMGGSVYSGNARVKAEFNIYHDPEAASIVFHSSVPLVMSGLEVCYNGAILLSEIEKIDRTSGKASLLARDILDFYKGWAIRRGMNKTAIFDMTTIAYLLYPEWFVAEQMNVDIECNGIYTQGMTVCEEISPASRINNPVTVLMDIDREAFMDFFFSALSILDKECIE